ncbi:MAG: hypothetical protein ACYC1Q_10170 [Bacteroidia bacterium]
MTRKEHLEFCSACSNRAFDPKQGIICGLTNVVADFDPTCDTYEADPKASGPREGSNYESVPATGGSMILSKEQLAEFRLEQNLNFAIITGVLTSIIGGLVWALITVTTEYQIGYMAVGIGALVGLGIRYAGRGIDPVYSYLGAGFALFGCLLGNFLSVIGFLSEELGITWMAVLNAVDFSLLIDFMAESSSPIDLLFYGIAVYEGFRFAPRVFENRPAAEELAS